MAKVAIVILNWNGEKLLKRFLPLVVKYTSSVNNLIVIADNASNDNSVNYVKENYPTLKVIELTENYGFAEGYNQALKNIDAEYFVLLNSDVEVTYGWLQPMIDYLDKHPDVAALQPKILSYTKKTLFEYAGASGGYIDKLGTPFCRGRILDTLEEDQGQYNSIIDIFWASGACMLIRSKDFFEAGGFDSSFFAHMEEIDLCWRLKARGRRIVCLPQSVVYHIGGATLEEGSAQKVYLNVRNNLLMLFKNEQSKRLRGTIKKRMLYNRIAALKYKLSGGKEKSEAIHQAHQDFKSQMQNYQSLRESIQSKVTVRHIPEIYKGNIIIDYFVKGRRKFSDLLL